MQNDKILHLRKDLAPRSERRLSETSYEGSDLLPTSAKSKGKVNENPLDNQISDSEVRFSIRKEAAPTEIAETMTEMAKAAGVPVEIVTDKEPEAGYGKNEAERYREILELEPVEVERNDMTKAELREVYNNLPRVNKNGNDIEFYRSAFKKIYKEGGLLGQKVPVLDQVLRRSVFAYSEPDNLGGTVRPDGTIHKKHPNVVFFSNYVGKIKLDGKEYYVRTTVENGVGQNGTHSFFVTDVEVYEKTAHSLSEPNFPSGESDHGGIIDAKLAEFFERARGALEKNEGSDSEVRFSIRKEGSMRAEVMVELARQTGVPVEIVTDKEAMVKKENPELWAQGKELMKETPLWEEVKNDPNYTEKAKQGNHQYSLGNVKDLPKCFKSLLQY